MKKFLKRAIALCLMVTVLGACSPKKEEVKKRAKTRTNKQNRKEKINSFCGSFHDRNNGTNKENI